MSFKFLFKENIVDQRLMQRVMPQINEATITSSQNLPKLNLDEQELIQQKHNEAMAARGHSTSSQSVPVASLTQDVDLSHQETKPLFTWKTPDGIDLSAYKGMWSYDDSKSAKWNRKNLKGFLKDQGLGDKADATGMIAEYLQHKSNQDPTSVSGSDRSWIKSKAGQYGYTLNEDGNRDYYKKTPSWVQTLATVFGGLTLGPAGAAAGYTLSQPKKPVDGYDGFYNPEVKRIKRPKFNKNGGIMQKFSQGGQVDPEEQVLLAATLSVIGYAKSQGTDMDIQTAASQVVDILQQDPNQLTQLVQNQELIKAGTQSLKPADVELYEKLKQPGAMKQYMSQIASNKSSNTVTKNQKTKAMKGTKLNYIKELKGICPEGYELQYFAAGGQMCSRCAKMREKIDEAKCGKKMKKKQDGGDLTEKKGGISKNANRITADVFDKIKNAKNVKQDPSDNLIPFYSTPRADQSRTNRRELLKSRRTNNVKNSTEK